MMNLEPGGSRPHLWDKIIQVDNFNIPTHLGGQPQYLNFPINHPDVKLEGQPKGFKQVLLERGLWDHHNRGRLSRGLNGLIFKCERCGKTGLAKDGKACAECLIKQAEASLATDLFTASQELPENNSVDCCSFKILSSQSDLATEKPILQKAVDDSGHMFTFLPRFHCKLNPIKLF